MTTGMNDDELLTIYRSAAADEYTRLRVGADNLDARLAELNAVGLRAVAEAAWQDGWDRGFDRDPPVNPFRSVPKENT